MLMPAAIQMPARTNTTAYARVVPIACHEGGPIAARFAAANSSSEGK